MPCLGFLGHQIISLALGETVKMSVGHHGANHLVNLKTGKIFITSQNHGTFVDEHGSKK